MSEEQDLIQTVYQALTSVEDSIREDVDEVRNQQEEVLREIESIHERLARLEKKK